MKNLFFISFLVLFLISFQKVQAQQQLDPQNILIRIEDAFRLGDASKLAEFIDKNTHFSFTSDLTGYFSYSQIMSMIEEYFKTYRPLKFRFSSKSAETKMPFAWGEYLFLKNGMRGSHKIFVSLQKSGESYYISQISINQ